MILLSKPIKEKRNLVAFYGVEGGTNSQCSDSCNTNTSNCGCSTNTQCDCSPDDPNSYCDAVIGAWLAAFLLEVPEDQHDC